ncbi:MAG: hypothetical protein IKV75_01560 [Bacteroidales bacterium]|nr:hypothetical protein [Bacteroidales bacterium]MBR5498830.1 hypothetical protein [Bacteroidales bacterium]
MKENESALYSRYVIDGIMGEATPAELLNECMEYPFDDEFLSGQFKDIVDETIEPPLSASSYSSSQADELIDMTTTGAGAERSFRMLYPDHFTRLQIAQALISRIWSKGHFRLGNLRLWAQWDWNTRPVGNMAAFYTSISEASDYIYSLGVGLTDYIFIESDGTSSAKFYAWLPETDPEEQDDISEAPHHPALFKAPYESSHPWISEERQCPRNLVKDKDSQLIYIPFDTCPFKLGGSLLDELSGRSGGAAPNIKDPDYFIDCYEVVRELVEDGVVMAGMSVGDGGLATAAKVMSQDCGLDLEIGGLMSSYQEPDRMKVLFGEIPGVLLQVSDYEYDYLDSQLTLQDVAYYPVGRPSDEHKDIKIIQSSKDGVANILASLLAQATEGED